MKVVSDEFECRTVSVKLGTVFYKKRYMSSVTRRYVKNVSDNYQWFVYYQATVRQNRIVQIGGDFFVHRQHRGSYF